MANRQRQVRPGSFKLIGPALALCALLAGCASLPGDQLADAVTGRVEISLSRASAPPVVLESGLGSYKEVWNKVFAVVAATNTIFAYDRPGVGRSAPTSRSRDGAAIVEDLRALLRAQKLQPPYLLVGHSAGGLYMQLYARRYPAEVAGLVLVDSTHPTQFSGQGSMSRRSALSRAVVAVALNRTAKSEFAALEETGREVLAQPPPRADLPIIILTAPDPSADPVAQSDNAKRADFARLYPGATLRQVDGGHDVPQSYPQAVIDAIREVLSAARQTLPAK